MKIYVVAIGDGGSAAMNHIASAGLQALFRVAVNTSAANLPYCNADVRLIIGNGIGAGGNPQQGKAAAQQDADKLQEMLSGADKVVLVAGMGGGTGTGAAPEVAKIAQDLEIDVKAIVSKPFVFEGSAREEYAEAGITELKEALENVIVVDYSELLKLLGSRHHVNLQRAYAMGAKMLAWTTMAHLI